MSNYTQKDGQGCLFINGKKENEKQPDLTGNVTIAGKQWQISGWKKQSQNGTEYISLSVKELYRPSTVQAPTKSSAKDPWN